MQLTLLANIDITSQQPVPNPSTISTPTSAENLMWCGHPPVLHQPRLHCHPLNSLATVTPHLNPEAARMQNHQHFWI